MARQYFFPLRECAATIAAEVIATGASTGWERTGVHEIAEILEPFEIGATDSTSVEWRKIDRQIDLAVGETLPAPPGHEPNETASRFHVQGYDVTTMPVLELEEKENALAREIFTKHLRIAQISALEDVENEKARKSVELFSIACLEAAELFYRGIGVNESDRVRVAKRTPIDVENIEKRMEFFLHEFLAGHHGPIGQSDLRKIAKTIVGFVLR